MKIIKGDTVQIMTGKDKGKKGEVLKVFKSTNRVLVEGVNIVKKHVKPGVISKEGGIISMEKPVQVSNVMYFSDKEKRPVRIGYKIQDGKKVRVSKSSGNILNRKVKTKDSKTEVKEAKKAKKTAPKKKEKVKETKKIVKKVEKKAVTKVVKRGNK